MQPKSVKIGWTIMLTLGIYRFITSIMLVVMGYGDITSGVYLATTAVAIIGITLGSYKKAEKWSWWCLLIIGIAPLLCCTLLHGFDPWTLVGWILFILAIIIPAKAILAK